MLYELKRMVVAGEKSQAGLSWALIERQRVEEQRWILLQQLVIRQS